MWQFKILGAVAGFGTARYTSTIFIEQTLKERQLQQQEGLKSLRLRLEARVKELSDRLIPLETARGEVDLQ